MQINTAKLYQLFVSKWQQTLDQKKWHQFIESLEIIPVERHTVWRYTKINKGEPAYEPDCVIIFDPSEVYTDKPTCGFKIHKDTALKILAIGLP